MFTLFFEDNACQYDELLIIDNPYGRIMNEYFTCQFLINIPEIYLSVFLSFFS